MIVVMSETRDANLTIFRDCISGPLIAKSASAPVKPQRKRQPKGRKKEVEPVRLLSDGAGKGDTTAEELAEFIDVGLLTSSCFEHH